MSIKVGEIVQKGQLANIPKEISKILVDDKKAEAVGGEIN